MAAPAPARLFARTPYGTSVWARVLFERYACLRPLHRVSAWLSDQGLPISAGTLGDSVHRFVPLFEPVAEAILAHQNQAAVRHGDETPWRIQSLREMGRSSRAWLWTSVSEDAIYFHIDPSRSAEVAKTLFGAGVGTVFLVCDRYAAYQKMAREIDGTVILAWCWAHQRRDFIQCAAGQTNPRFLILPWIRIPNLGSHILSLVRRHLPIDWAERYNITPVLIETFVETPRYTGAVYRASGWTHVGTTQGRGRYDRHTKRAQPKKDIWLRPLRKDWRRTLNR